MIIYNDQFIYRVSFTSEELYQLGRNMDHDDVLYEMLDWCENRYLTDTWNCEYYESDDENRFGFLRDEDRTLFILRWSA